MKAVEAGFCLVARAGWSFADSLQLPATTSEFRLVSPAPESAGRSVIEGARGAEGTHFIVVTNGRFRPGIEWLFR